MASVGFIDGFLTHDGRGQPLFQGIASTIPLFKWYNQSMVTLMPHNSTLLATSSSCGMEAFTIKGRPHIIGMQCGNHAAQPGDLGKWLEKDFDWFGEFSSFRKKFRKGLVGPGQGDS